MGKECEYRGVVDFGDGPVEVRCTEVGPHNEHKIFVILGKGPREGSIRHNVFEELDD
jgi:hypothetical protein